VHEVRVRASCTYHKGRDDDGVGETGRVTGRFFSRVFVGESRLEGEEEGSRVLGFKREGAR